jgi:outer membrane protein OmpA-like peptidoglycan-associated protein
MSKKPLILLFFLYLLIVPHLNAQPEIHPRLNKKELKLFFEKGAAIDIKRIKYRGASRAIGSFTDKDSIFNMASGIVLSSGAVKEIDSTNTKQNTTTRNWRGAPNYLSVLAGGVAKDAARIEITFVPRKEFISFNFVFGSEEYPEYVQSSFNDAFAFLLFSPDGDVQNLAVIPGTDDPITVNSVNYLKNQEYYVNNSLLEYNFRDNFKIDTTYFWRDNKKFAKVIRYNIEAAIKDDPKIPVEFDGFTKLLQAKANVIPNKRYKLIICIADTSDRIYDSGVLIEAGSFNASQDKDFKYGALATNRDYYYTVDTVLVDSVPETAPLVNTPCRDTVLNLHYDTDVYQLTDADRETIKEFISGLHASLEYTVTIDSYTDEVGTETYNQILSNNRAQRSRYFLESLSNIHFVEITAQGHGIDQNPEHNQAFRRRTVIRFVCN